MRRFVWFALIALAVLFLFAKQVAQVYTDWLWFKELGYTGVFWLRILAKVLVGFVVGAFFALLIGVNLVIAQKFITWRRWRHLPLSWLGQVLLWMETGFRWFVIFVAIAFGILAGLAAAKHWDLVLLFWFAQPMGEKDPIFGKDLSFFLFGLPFWRFIYGYLFGAGLLALGLTTSYYAFYAFVDLSLTGRYPTTLKSQIRTLMSYATPLIRTHLLVLSAILLFIGAVHFRLSMFELLYGKVGDEAVWGAGFTDLKIRLPALWGLTIVFVVGGLLVLANVWWRPPLKAGIVLASVFVIAWLSGNLLPNLVQRYVVKPNELTMEKPYLRHNIVMTRLAYGLHLIRDVRYPFKGELTTEDLDSNKDLLASVRLWDYRPLRDTLQQLQSIRAYYQFADVDVDRYIVDGVYRQVMIAARELNIEALRPTWYTRHFLWTHGFGVVVTPVNEIEEEGMPVLWVKDIPPQTKFKEFEIREPRIYFGELTNDYVIVRTKVQEFDYPKEGSDDKEGGMARITYKGKGGSPIGNYINRIAFALRFNDPNLLLPNPISGESKVLWRRNIHERMRAIAPFLIYDPDPYIVIADGRLFWICDAYTHSTNFPYSEPYDHEQIVNIGGKQVREKFNFNYMRNSVKVVIDAYNGTTQFYIADETDPIVKAYARIFPNLFRPLSEMPKSLQEHLRYPVTYFRIQADKLCLYHITDPEQFYQREDLWRVAQEVYEARRQEVEPYYVMMRLPNSGDSRPPLEFALILPFTPYFAAQLGVPQTSPVTERHNLVALMMARCDLPQLGELVILKMPPGRQIFGPAQVESRIDNDAEISQHLTLWRQHGSDVVRGNLLVIPMDGSLLYVEPLFLVATETRLPELKRVIVANQRDVVMDETLPLALERLMKRQKGRVPAPVEIPVPQQTTPPTDQPAIATELKQVVEQLEQSLTQAEESLKQGDFARFGKLLQQARQLATKLRKHLELNPKQ
ncbi:MAG: UPF0182 family protein [Armatimonadetes bacterium]|nr:UPF0182 family protein [Armatimonadota bacterium]MDW8029066.1 UPF0182 family protein [Armatimonadota bacterium]